MSDVQASGLQDLTGSGSAKFDSDGRVVPGSPGHITKANQA